MQENNYLTFFKASIVSFFTAMAIAGFSIMIGKNNLFLLLNTDLGNIGDTFFKYATYIGDGVVWAIFAIYILIFNRRKLPITLAAIVVSTLIAHYIKGHLITNNPRPMTALFLHKDLIHTIAGVQLSDAGSFPSGHTTQAFTMYFFFCILLKKEWIIWVGFFLALLVGYSRVYQAQHFPIDVAGGIIVGIISAWIALQIQIFFEKKWQHRSSAISI